MSMESRIGYRLAWREGRPVFETVAGGGPPPATYCDCILQPPEDWIARNRDFVESGVHLFFLSERIDWDAHATGYWTDEDVYGEPGPDAFCLDREAEALLAMDPEAHFFVRFSEMVPRRWAERHPDEMAMGHTGRRYTTVSWASELALEHYCRYLRHVIAWCERRPWAARIVGYALFPLGEGQSPMAHEGGFAFDVSPAMQRAYRAFVRERHGGDVAALREAWDDPSIAFEAVRVPTDAEWRERRERVLHFPEPHQLARERDYFALQRTLGRRFLRAQFATAREAMAGRPALLAVDAFKQTMLGWRANRLVDGNGPVTQSMTDWPELSIVSGMTDIADLLDDDTWQLLTTPADYTLRSAGMGWESEGVSDSLRLRGKALFVENDARTWVGPCSRTLGALCTGPDARAGLLRNTAWALSRGHLHYWMNVGSGFFHDPRLHEGVIRDERRLLDASIRWPHVETEHAVCLVLDDSSPWHEDGTAGYQHIACLWQRQLGLAHCGIPYRVYLFSDLERANMPPYRCYLFPNLFMLDAARIALLRERVLRDGRMAIFGPATGITDGTRLGADGLSELMDMPFSLLRQQAPRRVFINRRHPLGRALPSHLVYGDSYAYGPILLPDEIVESRSDVAVLGEAVIGLLINRPGLLVRECGRGGTGNGAPGPRGRDDCALAWTVAAPLPAAVLRALARHGGCHVWCEEDDVVLASETIAALHATRPGRRRLSFPTPRPVRDLLSGDKIGDALDGLDLELTGPETRIFYTGTPSPLAD